LYSLCERNYYFLIHPYYYRGFIKLPNKKNEKQNRTTIERGKDRSKRSYSEKEASKGIRLTVPSQGPHEEYASSKPPKRREGGPEGENKRGAQTTKGKKKKFLIRDRPHDGR